MTSPVLALYIASALATGTGWVLAAQEPKHRPVVALLTLGLVGDVVTRTIRPTSGWAHPLDGVPRAGFHVVQALLAGYPLAVLACAAVVLGCASRRTVTVTLGVGWSAYVVGLVAAYRPLSLWDGQLERTYAGAQVVVVVALLAVAGRWARSLRRARRPPNAPEVVALWLGGVEAINLFGPYLLGFSRWPTMARAAYALSYVVVILIQGGAAWRRWGRSAG